MGRVPDGVTGDTLHVEMVVGVYTPEKPVYQMEGFDAAAIQQKWDEGYYVIVDGDGMIFYDEEEQRLVKGFPGRVLDYEEQGLLRSEMKVSFDLDLKAARASVRHPDLPAPFQGQYDPRRAEHRRIASADPHRRYLHPG